MAVLSTNPAVEAELSVLSKDILRSLLYFNIFKFPLKIEELFYNSSIKNISIVEVTEEVNTLMQMGMVKKEEDYFFVSDNISIQKRIEGGKMSNNSMELAHRVGCFIACFPFVRGVFISGSLSKGYMDGKSDIDFFVVTAPNRLWLSRTLLVLFKKLFLFNSRKFFCPNYFIDTDHLEIPDQNIFTAKELNYLIPIYNSSVYRKLLESNEWREDFMPNFPARSSLIYSGRLWSKDFWETLLDGRLGDKLDDFCMKITERFWRKKYKAIFGKDAVSIRCKKYVSKFHPKGYQNKVIEKYKQSIRNFEELYNINLY